MGFAQDDDMVDTLASDRSDQSFGEAVSAKASLGQLACRGCPWPVIGGGRQRRRPDPDHGSCSAGLQPKGMPL